MNRAMHAGGLAALSLMFAAAAGAADATSVWTGTGAQVKANGQISQWTIALTLDARGNATQIEYPSLDCGGVLSLLRKAGEFREYRETITHGTERCTNNGTVGIRPKLGKLIWYWTGEGTLNPTGIDTAVLMRKSP